MKVIKKFLSMTVIAALCVTIMSTVKVSAGSIYFSGEYYKSDGAGITLNEYSSPEGKNVGNFQVLVPHAYNAYSGELMKVSNNKYRSKKKGLTFKVYKKKVVVTVSSNKFDKALKGTYKLTKRYPRP